MLCCSTYISSTALFFGDPNLASITGCSNNGAGNSEDFFLNQNNGDVWQKTTNTNWTKLFTFDLQSTIQATVPPAGFIIPFAGVTCPSVYLAADGSSYTVAQYANLFSAIGSDWGAVDSSHFNVPDLRGQFLCGVDNMGTAKGAAGNDIDGATRTVGVSQLDAFKSHNQTINDLGIVTQQLMMLQFSKFWCLFRYWR